MASKRGLKSAMAPERSSKIQWLALATLLMATSSCLATYSDDSAFHRQCQAAMNAADVNGDLALNQTEYLSMLDQLYLYRNCTNKPQLDDEFIRLACLCRTYSGVDECCKDEPSLATPGVFAGSYTYTVCYSLSLTIEGDCVPANGTQENEESQPNDDEESVSTLQPTAFRWDDPQDESAKAARTNDLLKIALPLLVVALASFVAAIALILHRRAAARRDKDEVEEVSTDESGGEDPSPPVPPISTLLNSLKLEQVMEEDEQSSAMRSQASSIQEDGVEPTGGHDYGLVLL